MDKTKEMIDRLVQEADKAMAAAESAEIAAKGLRELINLAMESIVKLSSFERSSNIERELEEVKSENKRLRERLQFDPGGSDKIDELEQSNAFTKAALEEAKAELEHISKIKGLVCSDHGIVDGCGILIAEVRAANAEKKLEHNLSYPNKSAVKATMHRLDSLIASGWISKKEAKQLYEIHDYLKDMITQGKYYDDKQK